MALVFCGAAVIHRDDVPLFASLFVLLVMFVSLVALAWALGVQVPVCQEDSVLVGVGSFNRGRWTQYECGPALDDCRGADVNGDGEVNVLDVQLVVNAYLQP